MEAIASPPGQHWIKSTSLYTKKQMPLPWPLPWFSFSGLDDILKSV
jgi:hypothetical protein